MDRQLADVDAIEQDPALLGFIEPAQQANHRGLPRSGGTHQGHMLAGGDGEGEIFEDRIVAAVGEGHPLKDHFPGAIALAATELGR